MYNKESGERERFDIRSIDYWHEKKKFRLNFIKIEIFEDSEILYIWHILA